MRTRHWTEQPVALALTDVRWLPNARFTAAAFSSSAAVGQLTVKPVTAFPGRASKIVLSEARPEPLRCLKIAVSSID